MTQSTLLVDWLGRGGIAQATEAWAMELTAHGQDVDVVTRPGRELGAGQTPVFAGPSRKGRIAAHRAVVQTAAGRIRDLRPDWVVVQNYLLPTLERPVFTAAHAVGAKVAIVLHDGRLHTWREGTGVGLVRNLRAADVVVVHSEHVASTVRRDTSRRDVVVTPLPVPIGMLSRTSTRPAVLDTCEAARWCGHFGVVRRRYKGTQIVEQLAARGVDGWRFAVLGAGAESSAGVHSVPGYLESGDLVAAVSATAATITPYKLATQSAVVVLAHVLGSVPIASSVGGIPEQIAHGRDGILVAPGSDVETWHRALDDLSDETYRTALSTAGVARAWADHAQFVAAMATLFDESWTTPCRPRSVR